MAAPPGSRTYGVPSAKIAWYAQAQRAGAIGRGNVFWPVPQRRLRARPARPTAAAGERLRDGRTSSRWSTRGVRSAAQVAARCGERMGLALLLPRAGTARRPDRSGRTRGVPRHTRPSRGSLSKVGAVRSMREVVALNDETVTPLPLRPVRPCRHGPGPGEGQSAPVRRWDPTGRLSRGRDRLPRAVALRRGRDRTGRVVRDRGGGRRRGAGACRTAQKPSPPAVSRAVRVRCFGGRDPRCGLTIRKAFRSRGGLAGGSADAAGRLVAADTLWGPASTGSRSRGSRQVSGSDVAFLPARRKPPSARVAARRSRRCSLPVTTTGVLAVAEAGLSTPTVYAELDRLRSSDEVDADGVGPPDGVLSALRAGDVVALGRALTNDLQPAALRLRPQLRRVLEAGHELGAQGPWSQGRVRPWPCWRGRLTTRCGSRPRCRVWVSVARCGGRTGPVAGCGSSRRAEMAVNLVNVENVRKAHGTTVRARRPVPRRRGR